MQKRILKYQAALFGNFSHFNFPGDPETTLKLTQLFVPRGFMPQLMNNVDQMGNTSQQLAFVKGGEWQIQFARERVDFVASMPSVTEDTFISEVVDYVAKLDHWALQFSRIALVVDYLLEDLSLEEVDKIRLHHLPRSLASPEWMARWAGPQQIGLEEYNVIYEAVNAQNMMIIVNNRMQPLNGVKVMHDVGTSPANTAVRFNGANLGESLKAIANIIQDQVKNVSIA